MDCDVGVQLVIPTYHGSPTTSQSEMETWHTVVILTSHEALSKEIKRKGENVFEGRYIEEMNRWSEKKDCWKSIKMFYEQYSLCETTRHSINARNSCDLKFLKTVELVKVVVGVQREWSNHVFFSSLRIAKIKTYF